MLGGGLERIKGGLWRFIILASRMMFHNIYIYIYLNCVLVLYVPYERFGQAVVTCKTHPVKKYHNSGPSYTRRQEEIYLLKLRGNILSFYYCPRLFPAIFQESFSCELCFDNISYTSNLIHNDWIEEFYAADRYSALTIGGGDLPIVRRKVVSLLVC